MTELKRYSCDRCGREFSKPKGENPSFVVRHDQTYVPEEDEAGKTFQLCDDCIVQFWNWEIHDEDFDKFAASMTKKWEKQEAEDK